MLGQQVKFTAFKGNQDKIKHRAMTEEERQVEREEAEKQEKLRRLNRNKPKTDDEKAAEAVVKRKEEVKQFKQWKKDEVRRMKENADSFHGDGSDMSHDSGDIDWYEFE